MTVASIIMKKTSTRKSVSYVGLSCNKLYHNPRPRVIQIDPTVTKTVRKTVEDAYICTRRMAQAFHGSLVCP